MKEPSYLEFANNIAALIKKDIYKPGDKLPSLRKLHKEHGLSVGTILKAFNHLIDQGIIVSEEKSGFFAAESVTKKIAVPQPAPSSFSVKELQINKLVGNLKVDGKSKDFVSFAYALPDVRYLPVNSLKRAFQEISRDQASGYLKMETAQGNVQLRQEIAKRSLRWKGHTAAEEIIITNGATEAILCCLKAVTKSGDTVLIQEPCFFGIMQILESLGLKTVTIPSDPETAISLPDFETACERFDVKACVFISNFNNPDGASFTTAQKKHIARYANARHIPVIEDDLYGDLHFDEKRPDTIKAYDTNGWVMYCSSYTKTLAPGFRLGWCAAGRFVYDVSHIKMMYNGSTSNITQQVISKMMLSGAYERHLIKYRLALKKNVYLISETIAQHFPEGTRITKPKGGIVIWVELPNGIDATNFLDNAFAKNISYAPGMIFSAADGFKNYLRISYSLFWEPRVVEALIKLGKLFSSVGVKPKDRNLLQPNF